MKRWIGMLARVGPRISLMTTAIVVSLSGCAGLESALDEAFPVKAPPAGAQDAAEPDTIAIGELVSGRIASPEEADTFHVRIQEGQRLVPFMWRVDGGDTRLRVLPAVGDARLAGLSTSRGRISHDQRYGSGYQSPPLTVPADDYYRVVVEAASGRLAGGPEAGSYQFRFVLIDPSPESVREQIDLSTLEPLLDDLPAGTTLTEAIDHVYDEDLFEIIGQPGEAVRVEVLSLSDDLKVAADVHEDMAGDRLTVFTAGTREYEGRDLTLPESGTLYVRTRASAQPMRADMGPYRLRILKIGQ